MNLRLISLVTALLTVVSFQVGIVCAQGEPEPFLLGKIKTCDHGFEGTAYLINTQKVEIRDFKYDGKGPSAWFHGQKVQSTGISRFDNTTYSTLPYIRKAGENSTCDKLPNTAFDGSGNITLLLPEPISTYKSIGLLCYELCNNFGQVVIDQSKLPTNMGLLPIDQETVTSCKTGFEGLKCKDRETVEHGIDFDCTKTPAQTNETKPMNTSPKPSTEKGGGSGSSDGVRFTCFTTWFIIPLTSIFYIVTK